MYIVIDTNNVLCEELLNDSIETPKARNGCSLCYDINTDSLYLYGGRVRERRTHTRYSDLWKYGIKQNKWNIIENNDNIPAKTTGHSMVIYKEYLIAFGGKTKTNDVAMYTNDLYVFDTINIKWKRVNVTNAPKKRYILYFGLIDIKKHDVL